MGSFVSQRRDWIYLHCAPGRQVTRRQRYYRKKQRDRCESDRVGGVTYLPLVGYNPGVDFTIDGHSSSPLRADIQPITSDYFRAIGIPLLRGRRFTDAEMKPQPDVAIVNNAFAKKFWPGEDSIGRLLQLQSDTLPRGPLVVVGVVGDVKQFGLHMEPRPEIYLPMRRHSMTLIVRTTGNPAQLTAAVRETVQKLDNRAAISMRKMEDVVNRSTWSRSARARWESAWRSARKDATSSNSSWDRG